MPEAGRLGDKSNVPSDSHGCPGCPHNGTGPAISGSPNVFINGQPALRIGDTGVHSACCGPNTWEAVQGSTSVFINRKGSHRKGDANHHCGGTGRLIEGSANVFIGGPGPVSKAPTEDEKHMFVVRVTYPDGVPLVGESYEIIDDQENVVAKGVLDNEGIARKKDIKPGYYMLKLANGMLID